MKVIIESIITLVENEDLEKVIGRSSKFSDTKVKDDYISFILDTQEIFNIAKTHGIEEANKSIDKVLSKYGEELKSKLSTTINN